MADYNKRMAIQTEAERDVDIDLRRFFMILSRRKLVLLGVMLIGISLAVLSLSFVKERYTARALVLIETSEDMPRFAPQFQSLINMVQLDTTIVLNEIEVISSRSMARKVIERLNLLTDPEYNPAIEANGPLAGLDTDRYKTFIFNEQSSDTIPASVIEGQIEHAVTKFLQNLDVSAVTGSNVIEISYNATSPKKAARIANAVANEYIEQRLETKFEKTRKVTSWLNDRLSELRVQVRESQEAVARYKREKNIAEGARTVISAEQLTQLNAQLISAKANYAELKARLEETENLALRIDRIETAPAVINSRLIQELKRDEAGLLRRISDLSGRYGDRHPSIINLRLELEDLREKLKTEMTKIVQSTRNEVRVAKARVEALEESINELKQTRHQDNEDMVQLEELIREAQSNKLIFDTFLETYKRSSEQEELQEPEAKVISYAVAPREPTFPDRPLVLSLAAALSLFVGLALAILIEKLDNTYRSANQLERQSGYPCFSLVPSVPKLRQHKAADFIIKNPSSTVAEAVRSLRTILNLRGKVDGKKPTVVTITSSFPGEGKSTLSSWLSRLAAKSGEKVLLIDGDLRRPAIHKNFGQKTDQTLVEYLTSKTELDDVIHKDPDTGLHTIYARSVPNSALDLISSQKMAQLVEACRESYDLVVIDSPACLAVSDARVLASLSDHTLYAVSWDKTPREFVLGGVKQFADMNYDPLAFVLTNVDVQKHVKYGYGDTMYYYGRYKEHYKPS